MVKEARGIEIGRRYGEPDCLWKYPQLQRSVGDSSVLYTQLEGLIKSTFYIRYGRSEEADPE